MVGAQRRTLEHPVKSRSSPLDSCSSFGRSYVGRVGNTHGGNLLKLEASQWNAVCEK